MDILERKYQTPEGFYDRPYIYTFQGNGLLTDGTSPTYLSTKIDGDSQFVLRRLSGLETIADKILMRDAAQNYWSTKPIHFAYDFPVIPEKIYPPGSNINFDLTTVAQAVNVNSQGGLNVNYSQLIFQGVRRFKGVLPAMYSSGYKYRTKHFNLGTQVSVTTNYWVDSTSLTSTPNPPLTIYTRVDDYDFELHTISVRNMRGASANHSDLALTLYDQEDRALSQAPVVMYLLQDTVTDGLTNGVFPVPTILYRAGSVIRLDVTSLLTLALAPSLPQTYEVIFTGVRRIPCQ